MAVKAQLHTQLNEPVRLRKLILESAIDATKLQQYLKSFKKIRKQKIEQQRMFKTKIKEIKELFHKIELESIPDLPQKFTKPKKQIKTKGKKITKKQIQKEKIPIAQDKLEKDLSDINKKLKDLEF